MSPVIELEVGCTSGMLGQLLLTGRPQVLLELRRDRGLDQPTRAGPKKLRERLRNPCWRRRRNHSIVADVRCAPLAETVFPNSISAKTRRTTQLIQTPLSTIALQTGQIRTLQRRFRD